MFHVPLCSLRNTTFDFPPHTTLGNILLVCIVSTIFMFLTLRTYVPLSTSSYDAVLCNCGHAILIKDMSGRQILLHATYAWRLDQEHLGTSQDLKYLIAWLKRDYSIQVHHNTCELLFSLSLRLSCYGCSWGLACPHLFFIRVWTCVNDIYLYIQYMNKRSHY